MVQRVVEVDAAPVGYVHTDEAAASRGVRQGLLLVGGANERGVAAIELDGLAIGRTELHVGRRQQVLQHNLLRRGGLVELVDIDECK